MGTFVYVANLGSDDVSGYSIDAATGALLPIPGSPFLAGMIRSRHSSLIDRTNRFAPAFALGR
jgi:6-phosphogluconolactonase